jgi:D-xylose reductase
MVEDNIPHIDTWGVMEDLVKKGLIRNIGVSNFNISLIRDLWNSCNIKPAVLQV